MKKSKLTRARLKFFKTKYNFYLLTNIVIYHIQEQ